MQISKSISSRKFRPDSFIWTLDSCYSICVWIRFLDSFYVRQFNPNLHSSVESLLCKPLINSYANRLVISISSFICIYKRILKISRSLNQILTWKDKSYACLKLLVWTNANFEIQPSLAILLKQLYMNSTKKVIKGPCQENVEKILWLP
jgi:hypothetical protein